MLSRRRALLLGVALAAATACTAAGGRTPGGDAAPASRAAWIRRPPAGCAVGLSGPTLNPGDALRHARRSARQALAEHTLAVRVESEWRDDGRHPREVTRHESRGLVRDARVVAMETRVGPVHGPGHPDVREVWALACQPDARAVRDAATSSADAAGGRAGRARPPRWVLDVPTDPERPCELGVAGPTRDPAHQPRRALDDGRRGLAEAIELWVLRRIEDDGRRLARVESAASPSDGARSLADERGALAASWSDPSGRGPLRLPGVLYALVCLNPA